MPGHKVSAAHSQLLIVDVQERLVPAMAEADRMVDRCGRLMDAARELGVPLTLSEQYSKGLGPTVEPLLSRQGNGARLEKNHFSCWEDEPMRTHFRAGRDAGRHQVVIGGIESHVCVTQTALDLAADNFDVFVCLDATSSRDMDNVVLTSHRLRQDGVRVIHTEQALFEWLHVSGTDEFKAVSKLVK